MIRNRSRLINFYYLKKSPAFFFLYNFNDLIEIDLNFTTIFRKKLWLRINYKSNFVIFNFINCWFFDTTKTARHLTHYFFSFYSLKLQSYFSIQSSLNILVKKNILTFLYAYYFNFKFFLLKHGQLKLFAIWNINEIFSQKLSILSIENFYLCWMTTWLFKGFRFLNLLFFNKINYLKPFKNIFTYINFFNLPKTNIYFENSSTVRFFPNQSNLELLNIVNLKEHDIITIKPNYKTSIVKKIDLFKWSFIIILKLLINYYKIFILLIINKKNN